ncbi:MAG: c-type cytochrome domain-containing protein, partial [Planctomycetota bacterium]
MPARFRCLPTASLPAPALPVRHSQWLLSALLAALCLPPLAAQNPAPAVAASRPANSDLWTQQVAPLLQQHCFSCHGPDSQESALRLDTLAGLNGGGHSGPPVIPGQPEESLLLVAVRRIDSSLQMPPEGRLSPEQIQILENWIQHGAVHPDGPVQPVIPSAPFDPREAAKTWSLRPLERPPVPAIAGPHIRTPIDAFINHQLQQRGLRQNPVADRLTLLRRAASQLTGLPPSPRQIQDYLDAAAAGETDARATDVGVAAAGAAAAGACVRRVLDVIRRHCGFTAVALPHFLFDLYLDWLSSAAAARR